MGIYATGALFGIKIYNFNDDDFATVLFEKTYTDIMSDEEKKKTYYRCKKQKWNMFSILY